MKQQFFSLITGGNYHGPIAYNPSASPKGLLFYLSYYEPEMCWRGIGAQPPFRPTGITGLKPANLLALILSIAIVVMAARVSAQPFTNNIIIASQHATLQAAIDAAGEQGMVLVDQNYQGLDPIVLPRRLRLVGMGPRGRAVLGFDGVLAGSAISIAPPTSGDLAAWVVIENLDINGPLPLDRGEDREDVSSVGIALRQANRVFLRNLSIHGFGVGVFGDQSSSVYAENCSVSESVTDNYRLTGQSDSWRITGGWNSFAGRAGVNIVAAWNTLIDGVRFENNLGSAILTNGIGTHITHNWFECPSDAPSCSAQSRSVVIATNAEQTSLIDNFYGEIAPILDNSNEQSTYRYDNRFAVQIHPAQGENALQVRYDGESEPTVVVDHEGRLRLGPDQGETNARVTINADENERGLRIRQGGVTRLLVDHDGSLGIGTGSPEATLHVHDRDSSNPAILVQGATGSEGDLAWPDDEVFQMGTWDANASNFTRRMAIDTNGRVHIDNELTFDPATGDKVSLFGNRIGQDDMYGFGVSPNTLYYKANGNHSWFVSSNATGTPEMHLDNTGLGIGTGNPNHKLVVQGNDPVVQIRDDTNDNSENAARLDLLERAGGTFDGGAYLRWNGQSNRLLIGTRLEGDDTTVLTVDRATSRVGIGTTDPQSDLHVSSGDFTRLRVTATSPANNVQMFVDARGDGTDRGQLGTLSNHDVVMFANNQPLIVLRRDGGVCIGNC